MGRSDILLTVLAAANGQSFTPAQLQKALFLVTTNTPHLFDEGSIFNFEPYDYGPFDKAVYDEANLLRAIDLCEIRPSTSGRWNTYSATDAGVERGHMLISQIQPDAAAYIRSVAEWVRQQSFSSLVRSIYESYPEMKANSIFRD